MNTDRIRTVRIPRQTDPAATPGPLPRPRPQAPRTRTLREIERHQFDRFERNR